MIIDKATSRYLDISQKLRSLRRVANRSRSTVIEFLSEAQSTIENDESESETMSPPFDEEAQASRNLPANGEQTEFLSTRVLAREAAKVCDDLKLPIRGARLRRLVERFVSDRRSDIDLRTWIICYADPTGEEAVRNVMRESERVR